MVGQNSDRTQQGVSPLLHDDWSLSWGGLLAGDGWEDLPGPYAQGQGFGCPLGTLVLSHIAANEARMSSMTLAFTPVVPGLVQLE